MMLSLSFVDDCEFEMKKCFSNFSGRFDELLMGEEQKNTQRKGNVPAFKDNIPAFTMRCQHPVVFGVTTHKPQHERWGLIITLLRDLMV
jgi:hypothetical protein